MYSIPKNRSPIVADYRRNASLCSQRNQVSSVSNAVPGCSATLYSRSRHGNKYLFGHIITRGSLNIGKKTLDSLKGAAMTTITVQSHSVDNIDVYEPSSRFGILTFPYLLIPGLVGGVGAAFVIHLIWQWTGFYLMWFFPVGIGMASGFAMMLGGNIGKNRNPLLGAILGFMVGTVSYVSMHYFDAASYGTSDILEYLSAMAKEGYVMIFIPISGPFAWLSWIAELGIVVFFTTSFAGGSATMPFCEKCNQWTDSVDLFSTNHGTTAQMIEDIREKKFHLLEEHREHGFNERNQLKAGLDYCEKCKRTGFLTLTSVIPKGGKDDTEDVIVLQNATVGANVTTLLSHFPKALEKL